MSNQNDTKIRSLNFGGFELRSSDEKANDDKYDAHAAGDCDWATCEWCIAAEHTAEESKGG